MKKKILILFVSSLLSYFASSQTSEKLSNGIVEVRINSEKGTFDIFDLKNNQLIIENSKIGFSVAEYFDLGELDDNQVETNAKVTHIISSECSNRIGKSSMNGVFPDGNSISLYSKSENIGELEVKFTLYPNKSFVDIGFSFRNLAEKPVRLRQVDVVNSGQFFPGYERENLKLLNGDSGGVMNKVQNAGNMLAENNMLCYIMNSDQQRSLVLGGLTYADYRKYIKVESSQMIMYATDPVGKRIDPGKTYKSKDCFYIDGIIKNPFEALESYAENFQKAEKININYYTFPSVCLWFLAVSHFGGDTGAVNNTVGAIKEMENIIKSGFLKYSPVAVRLVPDCYEQNNEQGWWDDEHWQMHGRKERCIVGHHYEIPYETTKKWASKVHEMGGIPFTYFQPGIRSEDYAKAFPGHMLYNKANKYILKNDTIVPDPHIIIGDKGIDGKPGYGKKWQESYDYTDKDFIKHLKTVYKNLKNGGVKGIFYDYPDRALPVRGGMDDRYATALSAYTNVYRIAREKMGDQVFLQERLGPGSDATLKFVSSVRTAGDNNIIRSDDLTKVALRWYKNRRLTNYDMDGKALLFYGPNRDKEITDMHRRAILTLSYTITGRLLLTESFRLFPEKVLYDLSRVFPFHATTLTARPLDAFIRENPSVFDFPISEDWHQLVLYNDTQENRQFNVKLSGNTAFGSLGMDTKKEYFIYDFWNDVFVGRISGSDSIKQSLHPGEACMLSVHKVENNPQFISTNRHIMQGYVDMIEINWDDNKKELSGKSNVVAGETYKIVVATNGRKISKFTAKNATANWKLTDEKNGLITLSIDSPKGGYINWTATFE